MMRISLLKENLDKVMKYQRGRHQDIVSNQWNDIKMDQEFTPVFARLKVPCHYEQANVYFEG